MYSYGGRKQFNRKSLGSYETFHLQPLELRDLKVHVEAAVTNWLPYIARENLLTPTDIPSIHQKTLASNRCLIYFSQTTAFAKAELIIDLMPFGGPGANFISF